MWRLLQGDVGSGKTLVAFLAALRIFDMGGQTAFLAPTELLARQHGENAAKLLDPLGVRIAFLTGTTTGKDRALLLEALKNGNIDFLIGTHALFSKDVVYKDLKLAIIDEQHRFGVMQRSAIARKGNSPHLLMMSATPIPRSLALTVFGDLDVSVIKTMPKGRKPVITHLASLENDVKVYSFVRNLLAKGQQGYFVYPLIQREEDWEEEESETESFSHPINPQIHIIDNKSKILFFILQRLLNVLNLLFRIYNYCLLYHSIFCLSFDLTYLYTCYQYICYTKKTPYRYSSIGSNVKIICCIFSYGCKNW